MPLKEPTWWYSSEAQHSARLLGPLGYIYGRLAARRLRFAQPYTSIIPVICVGNFTAGGTGKTPLTLLLAEHLQDVGERPALLTRGYGGSLRGPHLVSLATDNIVQTGDEALLLARRAPTIVSRNRAAGARFIEDIRDDKPTVIVMDDGFQNPSIAKMLRLVVVDARRGIGNGQVIPAGPLRAPLVDQLAIADAIVVNTGPMHATDQPVAIEHYIKMFRALQFSGPILRGGIVPRGDLGSLKGKRVLAFAGIGHPERFFDTLRLGGVDVAEAVSFKDHHFFDAGDAERLLIRAKTIGAQLVTTEKDHVRLLSYDDQRGELANLSFALEITMSLAEEDMRVLAELIQQAIKSDDLVADQLVRCEL